MIASRCLECLCTSLKDTCLGVHSRPVQCHNLEADVNGGEVLKRLEQISAIVVAVGLALVSYWLFFSWAGGGDAQNRQRPRPQAVHQTPLKAAVGPAPGTGPKVAA